MRIDSMKIFLSDDTLKSHLEFYRRERCRYSILEKSIPEIKGKTLREIYALPLSKSLKNEILPKIILLKSHELYFSSFCEKRKKCKEINEYYSSEAAFLYEIAECAKRMHGGFLYIVQDRLGRPVALPESEAQFGRGFAPRLAIDLCEHAYFLDYRFDRERYVCAALSALDLNEIFSEENSQFYLDTTV